MEDRERSLVIIDKTESAFRVVQTERNPGRNGELIRLGMRPDLGSPWRK